ncbi:MAG: FAD binding domain-containing protein [Kibdelosporangium sp.]
MDVLVATSLAEVHEGLRRSPGTRLLAGGTDLLVELRTTDARPPAVLCVGDVPELLGWHHGDEEVTLGAGVTLSELAGTELSDLFPALGVAARSVACPQIRNAATLGGNIATAAPTSDLIPVLAALDATAEVAGPHGRELRIGSAADSVKPGDVVVAVRVPLRRTTQTYLRVGARRGMAFPTAAVAVVVDLDARTLRCAVGGHGRAVDAELWVADHIDWAAGRVPDPRTYESFGELVATSAGPPQGGPGQRDTGQHNGVPVEYWRHAVGVLARRALMGLL